MKWWRETAVWCGMSWCDVFCGMDKVCVAFRAVCSLLCSVHCNVSSVLFTCQ